MTAAQTVTAAVCCQTLRGEEGKREQGYSHRNFDKLRHFTYPPFSIFYQQIRYKISRNVLDACENMTPLIVLNLHIKP